MRLKVSILALLLIPLGAGAQSASSTEFLAELAKAPALKAAAQRSAAAKARVGSSAKLGDVQVEGMGSRMVGPMDERAQMWELTVKQPLPKAGERSADRKRAEANVAMAEADYAVMAGEMAADTAMALAEAQGAEARIRLLKTQVERMGAVLRSVEVKLAAGREGRLADRLSAQTQIASMQLMIEEESKMAADVLAEARARLGLPSDAPLPSYVAPLRTDIQPDEAAEVKLAGAKADEANAMIKMAQASGRPMTAVGVKFNHTRTGMGNEDTLGLLFMTDIPWRSRKYAGHDLKAAQAERAAANTDASAVKFRISSALSRVDRAQALADSARRLGGETLGRLNAEYDSLLKSASAGAGMAQSTVMEIVELLDKGTQTELQILRADTAVLVARSELWRYVPVSSFQKPAN